MANTNINDNTEQETNPCFVLTLPLKDEPWQHHNLDTLFKVGNNAKNCLIADKKKALEQLERTHKWHDVQDSIRNVYQSFETEKDNYDPETAALELQKRLKPFFKIRNRLLSEYGLSFFLARKPRPLGRGGSPHPSLLQYYIAFFDNIQDISAPDFRKLFFS